MKFILLALFVSVSVHANESEALSLINNEKSCFSGVTADYNSWRDFIREKNSKGPNAAQREERVMKWFDAKFPQTNYDRFKRNLKCSEFTYQVDGVNVKGYYAHPINAKKKELPVLIYNRGGNGYFSAVNFASQMKNIFPFADQGFVVIGTQYSGVAVRDSKRTDEFGGKDIDDVIALLGLLPAIEVADETKVGMYGSSRGGMQSFLTLKKLANTNQINALATIAALTNLPKSIEERPEMEKVYATRIPNYAQDKETQLKNRSVVFWVDKLPKDVPILLIHGAKDKKVDVKNAIDFAALLEENQHPYELEIYEEDGHIINVNEHKMQAKVVNWFKSKLL